MLNKDYKEMLQTLLEEEVDFIIVGAYALGVHGYPRATGDIDIWIKPDENNSKKILKALARFGVPVAELSVNDFAREGVVYQIGVVPRRIDIITKIEGVTYKEANDDKIIIEVENLKLPFISFEMLLKNKLATGREKDALDAKVLINRNKLH